MKLTLSALLLLAAAPLFAQAPAPAAPNAAEQNELGQVAKTETAEVKDVEGQIKAAHDKFTADMKPVEEKLLELRKSEIEAINPLRAKLHAVVAAAFEKRIAIMEKFHPGSSAKMKEHQAKMMALNNEEMAKLKVLHEEEAKEFTALRAKYQEKAKALTEEMNKKRFELTHPGVLVKK